MNKKFKYIIHGHKFSQFGGAELDEIYYEKIGADRAINLDRGTIVIFRPGEWVKSDD